MIYGKIETNIISQKSELEANLQKKVPEGAIYFEGIVSTGDKNRNGYVIDSNAWFFDKGKYVKNFLKSGSVLLWHNTDKPIWRPLSFELVENEIKVSGYVFDDTYTNGDIWRGLILWLSTGHITHASLWRNNKTGLEMKEKEFYDKLWNDEKIYKEYANKLWDWVVTEAEIVEFSFVTTPSNRKSTINGIDEELINDMSKHLNKSTEEVGNLFTKYNSMEVKENVVVEGEKVETNEAVLEVNALKSEVEVLKNSLETMKNDILARDEKIVTLTNELQQKDETLQANETLINELRKVEEEKVLAQANITKQDPKEEKTENSVNSLEDYKKKYS